jgi:hypothetical protein
MVAYKNFWSLNTDEAVVTGILREHTSKEVDVLMPINAQMKDIDLVLMNFSNKKTITIQVKGSKAYEPKKNEVKKFGENGSTGWFFLKKEIIHKSKADYFIFLVYVINENKKSGRRFIEPHTLTIPTNKLKKLCLKYKKPHPERYSFYFWIDPKNKIAFDWRDEKYNLTKYLDKKGFEKLNKKLN